MHLSLLLAAPLILGQAQPAGAQPVQAQVRDSAGVRIVAYAEMPEGLPLWRVGPEPDLRIGSLDGSGPDVFADVSGVAIRSDGSMVIADGPLRRLKAFDPAGNHLWTAGGRGEGPGEFEVLTGVAALPGDSVLAWGGFGNRFNLFSPDGTHQRTLGLQLPEPQDSAEVQFGIAPRQSVLGVLGDGTLVTTPGTDIAFPGNPMEPGWSDFLVARHALDGGVLGIFGRFPLTRYVEHEGRVPFLWLGPSTQVGVGEARVVIGTQQRFELLVYGESGALELIVRVSKPRVPSDVSAFEAYNRRLEIPTGPVSDSLPAYGRTVLDSEGRVWVEEYIPPYEERAPTWWVFGSDGAALATASLPTRFRPFHITADWMLGVRRDEFDVAYVERLPINR